MELANTDHQLLVACLRTRLQISWSEQSRSHTHLSFGRPPYPIIIHLFNLKQIVSCLRRRETPGILWRQPLSMQWWTPLGHPSWKPKQAWISSATLCIIEECHMACLHGDLAAYRHLYHVRNARIQEDHLKYWEDQAAKLEDTACQHDIKQMYKHFWQFHSGPRQKSHQIKHASGKVITLNEECVMHWAEHFKCLLNHPLP